MRAAPFQLTLMVGSLFASPASAALTGALRHAEVTTTDSGPSGFQLQFQAIRGSSGQDYELLSQLKPFSRVVLVATINYHSQVIADGLITHVELAPGQRGQPDMLNVTGEDISVAMDLKQQTVPYPGLNDALLATFILLQYMHFGLIPLVIPTLMSLSVLPLDYTPQQPGMTDRAFLNTLADRNGYVFQIIPGPRPLTNVAYFGPPRRIGIPQAALTVNELPASNVTSLRFSYNALDPTVVLGSVQDTLLTDMDIPVIALTPLRLPTLASRSATLSNFPYIRTTLLDPQGMDPIQAYIVAQGMVNKSVDKVLTATGEVDVLRYGSLLSAPGLVGLRGAGATHDGMYYVQQVVHQITPESYTQQFTLTREGWGSTVSRVTP